MSVSASGPAADRVGLKVAAVLASAGAPPALVKAAADAAHGWGDLPPIAYADDAKSYPIHDALAATTSALFYHRSGGVAGRLVGDRIKAACAGHGVPDAWDKAAAVPAPRAPKAYALPALKKYPLDTAEQVKSAGDYLVEYGDRFTDADRKEFATNLLAADHGTLLPRTKSAVEHAAGLGRPAVNPDRVFLARKQQAKSKEAHDQIAALETELAAGGDPYATAVKLAALDERYGWKLPNPRPLLTGLTPSKAAVDFGYYVTAPCGDVYRAIDLARVPATALMDAYATGAVVGAEKRAALLRDHGEQFQQFLADFGVEPVRRMARPAVRKIDWAEISAG